MSGPHNSSRRSTKLTDSSGAGWGREGRLSQDMKGKAVGESYKKPCAPLSAGAATKWHGHSCPCWLLPDRKIGRASCRAPVGAGGKVGSLKIERSRNEVARTFLSVLAPAGQECPAHIIPRAARRN